MKCKIFLMLFIVFSIWVSIIPSYFFENNIEICYFSFSILFLFLWFFKNTRNEFTKNRDLAFWSFIFCVIVSFFFSLTPVKTLENHLYIPLVMGLMYSIARNIGVYKNKYFISYIFCILGLIVGLYGIIEFITEYNILYEQFFSNQYYKRYLSQSRIMSTQYHPSVLGTYFMVVLPFGIFLTFCKRNKKDLLLGITSLAIILSSLTITFTRTAILATFVLLSIYLFVEFRKKYFIFLIFCVIFLILMTILSNYITVLERFDITSLEQVRGIKYRLKRFPTAFKIFKLSPITGVGFGNFRYLFDKYHTVKDVLYEFKIPDNMYLSLLSETGLLGAISFIYLCIYVLNRAINRFKTTEGKDKRFILLMMCGFVGILINMLSYDLFYWFMPLYFFSIYIGFINSDREDV